MRSSLRFEVFKRDSFTCRYCGVGSPQAILEVDHVHPKSAGGTDDLENLVTACFQCNRGKAARLLSDVPTEANIHERTIEIAERELQLEQYTYWKRRRQEREDNELEQLENMWVSQWGDRHWRRSSARQFLRALGVVQLEEFIEYVTENATPYAGCGLDLSAWKFFCGMCWRRIKGDGNQPLGGTT